MEELVYGGWKEDFEKKAIWIEPIKLVSCQVYNVIRYRLFVIHNQPEGFQGQI
jgi:hypothetical protein